jgi:7,8-dihydropterin-6-yl-methyl-4-(beta-D-ribofuranosyl)aminobenzene 5'-phosphate synthase
MKARITVLCENTVGALVGTGEHGFSAFIETEAGKYLFDTGSGSSIIRNALLWRKDLTGIKKIFLSHGHRDHTGGLPEVLTVRGEVEVLAHPHIFVERIAVLKEDEREEKRFAGIPYRRGYLEFSGARFVLKKEFYEPEKGVFLTGEVPRNTSFEKPDPRLFAKMNGDWVTDQFLDDQSLVLDTPKGLVIIFGCAHSGMINTINHVMEKMGMDKIYAILGGTHLQFLTSEQLEESIEAIKRLAVEYIGVSHCTGMRASMRLAQEFGDRFFSGHVGAVFET